MLAPELDKLRDKTLSFWCIIHHDSEICPDGCSIDEWRCVYTDREWINCISYEEEWSHQNTQSHISFDYKYEVHGHPLTRWRIAYLFQTNVDWWDKDYIASKVLDVFESSLELYNQDELQRIEDKKVRLELKGLLIQFSNYL